VSRGLDGVIQVVSGVVEVSAQRSVAKMKGRHNSRMNGSGLKIADDDFDQSLKSEEKGTRTIQYPDEQIK
jgi:hypothetical protein